MRRVLMLAVLVVVFAMPASGQQGGSARLDSTVYNTVITTAYAHEVLTVGAVAKKLTSSLTAPADRALKGAATEAWLSVEVKPIRLCLDGTTASATDCHVIPAGADIRITGFVNITQVSMYAGADAATIHVTYFRQAGK